MPRITPLVFLSSTRQELGQYRSALVANLPHLDIVCRGMEFFGAHSETPRRVIRTELEDSDLYVGILAHRYGSIERGSGLSYTELEYETATKLGIDRLVFLIDPNHPVPPSSYEQNA